MVSISGKFPPQILQLCLGENNSQTSIEEVSHFNINSQTSIEEVSHFNIT